MKIFSKHFFSNYIFHPKSKELSKSNQRKAVICSVAFSVLTIGICHLVCYIAFRRKKITIPKVKPIQAQKADDAFNNSIRNEKNQSSKAKMWTTEELLQTSELGPDKIFEYAEMTVDIPEKISLLTKAAEMGHAEAMCQLGDIYRYPHREYDPEIKANVQEAIRWYEKAAENKNAKACQALANIYSLGIDTAKEIEKAKKWAALNFDYGAKFLRLNRLDQHGKITGSTIYPNKEQALASIN